MKLLQRIGTQPHKFKVELTMRRIKFTKKLTGQIVVKVHRGEHKEETKQTLEMSNAYECDLRKEVIAFPSLTLYKEDALYQAKEGEMKVVMIKANGDKKLIGIVPFDLAEFANSNEQHQLTLKRKIEEIPEKLKMEGEIEFSVFCKFIGEGSETDKTGKDGKKRSQSPFDKLKTFFLGDQPQKPQELPTKQQASTSKQIGRPINNNQQEVDLPPRPKKKKEREAEQQRERSPQGRRDWNPPSRNSANKSKKDQALSTQQQQPSPQQKVVPQEEKPKASRTQGEKRNMVQHKQRNNFSEYEQKPKKRNEEKSEHAQTQQASEVKIYFDDPSTFSHLAKHPHQQQSQPHPEGEEPKGGVSTASPKRKVKENSIQISKESHRDKNRKEDSFKKKQAAENTAQRKEAPKVQPQQIVNIFTTFEQPRKEEPSKAITLKRVQDSGSVFLREELERKEMEILQLNSRLVKLQTVEKRLQEQESQRSDLEKTITQLKEQNKRLEKEGQRMKEENESLRAQQQSSNSQSSFFRGTVDHYADNSEEVGLEEECRRLEREKSEMAVVLTKEKERHRRELREAREELEKERNNYRELQNLSKIELKKVKDENLKLTSALESSKEKGKEKGRENETLLGENKRLNEWVIELKDKLAALKIKICEKLNEANERGQAELMEALTDLSQDV